MDDWLRELSSGASNKPTESAQSNPLQQLLGSLLGGGQSSQQTSEEAGAAAPGGISPVIAQAALALIAGKLAGGAGQGEGAGLQSLLEQAGKGEEIDATALRATGVAQELSATTGLDMKDALKLLKQLLPWLAKLQIPGLTALSKPAQSAAKPSASAKPKPKPSTASAKPKPKPAAVSKPSSHAASTAKPKNTARPKPASSSAKPAKSKARKKPAKRSGTEDVLGGGE